MAEIKSWEEFKRLKEEGYYTPKQVASELDCSVSNVYRLIQEGKLKAYTLGGRKVIFKRDLDEFVARFVRGEV